MTLNVILGIILLSQLSKSFILKSNLGFLKNGSNHSFQKDDLFLLKKSTLKKNWLNRSLMYPFSAKTTDCYT